jgi:hypothetical protein
LQAVAAAHTIVAVTAANIKTLLQLLVAAATVAAAVETAAMLELVLQITAAAKAAHQIALEMVELVQLPGIRSRVRVDLAVAVAVAAAVTPAVAVEDLTEETLVIVFLAAMTSLANKDHTITQARTQVLLQPFKAAQAV